MLVVSSISSLNIKNFTCLSIGTFDGVHKGHRFLIESALGAAKSSALDFILMTFWPHPKTTLNFCQSERLLSTREERLAMLETLGTKKILEITFNQEFANQSPEDFAETWLKPLNLKHLIIGYDFNFGKGRKGDLKELQKLGQKFNFTVEQSLPYKIKGQPVSSTEIRKRLCLGDVYGARELLGYFYSISGNVEHGFGRGTSMGIPTANLVWNNGKIIPADGVYATIVNYNGKNYQAVTNIGNNPTFNGKKRTIESFLLDCDDDLYDQNITVHFIKRLRDSIKFSSTADLVRQINSDICQAKYIFAHGNFGFTKN